MPGEKAWPASTAAALAPTPRTFHQRSPTTNKRFLRFASPWPRWRRPLAHANDFTDLRGKLSAARESLVTMLVNKDKRGSRPPEGGEGHR